MRSRGAGVARAAGSRPAACASWSRCAWPSNLAHRGLRSPKRCLRVYPRGAASAVGVGRLAPGLWHAAAARAGSCSLRAKDPCRTTMEENRDMSGRSISRRRVLSGLSAAPVCLSLVGRARAASPQPTQVTPELIEAAKKEGKVSWYTAVDLPVAERIAKAFEGKYPGIAMRVERSGGERIYQRIGQEYASNIHAVDVVNSSDAAHFIAWKRAGILAPYVPDDVALNYAPEHRDGDGLYASWRVWLSVIGYNNKLVSPAEAPKSFADLLDPKWTG